MNKYMKALLTFFIILFAVILLGMASNAEALATSKTSSKVTPTNGTSSPAGSAIGGRQVELPPEEYSPLIHTSSAWQELPEIKPYYELLQSREYLIVYHTTFGDYYFDKVSSKLVGSSVTSVIFSKEAPPKILYPS